jgi:phosphoadenosine phosphosulfate reductase
VRGLSDQLTETLQRACRHEQLVFLCSFQKEESVILDELLAIAGGWDRIRVVTIDTGVLFPETLATWKRFEEHYGVDVEVQDAANASNPWTGPEHCCTPLKVAALERSLEGADAWVTGVRRDQAETRADAELVEPDAMRPGVMKYNPLAFWSEKDVWSRILERGLPYHPLHDQGYASIGCATCTQPGDGRAGRWAGTDKTECGLHVTADAAIETANDSHHVV